MVYYTHKNKNSSLRRDLTELVGGDTVPLSNSVCEETWGGGGDIFQTLICLQGIWFVKGGV